MKTLKELIELSKTPEARESIVKIMARLQGYVPSKNKSWTDMVGARWLIPNGNSNYNSSWVGFRDLPNYCGSYDVVTPLVRSLQTDEQKNTYINALSDQIDPMGELGWKIEFEMVAATPVQICIALIIALQKP